MTAMSIAMAVLVVVATVFTAHFQPKPFDIGDYSHVDINTAQERFADSQSNEDLVLLCKVLSWNVETNQDESARELLKQYGQELLDRAKAESVDLETIDDPEIMLSVLRVIRESGAK